MKITPFLLAVVCLSLVSAASGALCPKCQERSYTKDLGECTVCQGLTTSGEFKLCLQCSRKLGECAHCRAALASKTGPQPEPIDPERGGTYRAGAWVYELRLTNEGSRSQGLVGLLAYGGVAVGEPSRVNDYHVTPWGKLYWVGNPIVAWGAHGWMLKPLNREAIGVELPAPAAGPAP